MKLKDHGIPQALAAELLGTSQASVSQTLSRGRGPLHAGLTLLAATWPLLSEAQRDQVRRRVAALRAAGDAAAAAE